MLWVDALLGWLLPGAGHLSRGFRRQGWIALFVIVPIFSLGLVLSDFEAVSRDLHPYAFWAELGFAGATLPLLKIDPAANKVLPDHQSITNPVPGWDVQSRGWDLDVSSWSDTGVLFCCVAGLLNLLALFDLLDRSLSPHRAVRTGQTTPEGSSA